MEGLGLFVIKIYCTVDISSGSFLVRTPCFYAVRMILSAVAVRVKCKNVVNKR